MDVPERQQQFVPFLSKFIYLSSSFHVWIMATIATLYHLILSYGSHKYTLDITDGTTTAANLKLLLCTNHLPAIDPSTINLLAKGGKHLDNSTLLASFAKINKKTKLKLLFSSDFNQLTLLERERRLNGGVSMSTLQLQYDAISTKTNSTATTTASTNATTTPAPEMEPDTYIVAIHVKHAKQKHVLYFTDENTANIGGLRARLNQVTGVPANRQRLVVSGKVIGMGTNAKNVNESETLLSLSKGKKKLKIKLLFDAKHHHAVASTVTLKDVRDRLLELEKLIGSMHRKITHNFFDEAQMIVEGRSFDYEIAELIKSVDRLPKAEAVLLKDMSERVEVLKRLSSEIEEGMEDAMRR
mgnify:CR=1 FL=1